MPNTGALGSPDQRAYQSSLTPNAAGGANAAGASPLTQTTAGLLTSPNWQNQVAGYLAGQYGPQFAQSGLTSALTSQQLAMLGPQLGVQEAELTANTGFGLASDVLAMQGIGLQSQGLASQIGTAAAQQGIEQAQYGVQQGQYPEQLQRAALENANAVQQMQSQGAIGGTINTEGYKKAQATQAAEYGWQQADIFRAQQLAQLAQQSEQVGYGGQQAQYANQQQQLALAARQQGLNVQQAGAQLGFGLQQLGYQAQPEQFLSQLMAAQGGEAQNLAAFGSQASLVGGLGPAFTMAMGG
jgi:hypothetical protein